MNTPLSPLTTLSEEEKQEKIKKELLKKLLDAVKCCQCQFGSRAELATEDELSLRKLCLAFEDIFFHGVKRNIKSVTGIWQMTVPAGLLRSNEIVTFWPLIKTVLSKHESERFILLHNVRTDLGRSKAWLRAALNEHSLERFMLMILSLEDLNAYYEPWSFLLDPELSSILPQSAAGLGSVIFALIVDNPSLDNPAYSMEKKVSEPIIAESLPEIGEVAEQALLPQSTSEQNTQTKSHEQQNSKIIKKPGKKKTKKVHSTVISFDDNDDNEILASEVSTPVSVVISKESTSISPNSSMISTMPECSKNTNSQFDNNNENESDQNQNYNSSSEAIQIASNKSLNNSKLKENQISLAKSVDCLSVNSDFSDRIDNISLSGISPNQRLKPVFNEEEQSLHSNEEYPQDLIPVPNYDEIPGFEKSEDFNYDLESEESQSHVFEPENYSNSNNKTNIKPKQNSEKASETKSSSSNNNNNSEIREERIQKLKIVLDHQIELVAKLKAELAEEKREHNDQTKILESRIEKLTKDNEIIRFQLKKYIGAVQLLKMEGNKNFSLNDNDIKDLEVNPNKYDQKDADEAAEYERKLIQVAEMHGELMEFNAHLQKILKRKDLIIKQMWEEIVDIRGPLASPSAYISGFEELNEGELENLTSNLESSNVNSSTNNQNRNRFSSSSSANERVLINIWIPSAFLTGATNDLHHVYQVFIRIKDTEWNIFKRYSEFYSLHKDLKKKNNMIGTLYFPPKKHIGNKDSKFVDERRRKLQEYLRKIINLTLQSNPVLASHPEKTLLTSILPFFGEVHSSTVRQKCKIEKTPRRNLFFRSSQSQSPLQNASIPHYTGL